MQTRRGFIATICLAAPFSGFFLQRFGGWREAKYGPVNTLERVIRIAPDPSMEFEVRDVEFWCKKRFSWSRDRFIISKAHSLHRRKYDLDTKEHFDNPGPYIGTPEEAKYLVRQCGLVQLQPAIGSSGTVCQIGFSPNNSSWYGWSHRAINSFGHGDMIFEEGFGDDFTPFAQHGTKPIENWDDAMLAASNFARSVA